MNLFLFISLSSVFFILINASKKKVEVVPNMKLVDKSKMHITSNMKNVKYSNNATSGASWAYFNQCDSRWSTQQLGWCEGYDICHYGCAISSVSMILATKGVDVNPSSFDVFLSDNGGYIDGCDIVWAMADAYGVTSFQGIEYADESAICDGLAQDHGIIACVNGCTHFVLLTGCLGGGVFTVNDPAFSRSTYSMDEITFEAVYH